MGALHETITPELVEFIREQPLFFVASAPLSGEGHVNVSPKGMDTFRLLSPTRVMYLDLTGSGNETAAHVRENGRVTIMFCAFDRKPRILRLYGKGKIVRAGDAEWEELIQQFDIFPGVRQIVGVDVTRVQTSCGFGVPLMRMEEPRTMLMEWAEKKGPEGLADYRQKKNRSSIDGLPTGI